MERVKGTQRLLSDPSSFISSDPCSTDYHPVEGAEAIRTILTLIYMSCFLLQKLSFVCRDVCNSDMPSAQSSISVTFLAPTHNGQDTRYFQ
jgi:hypothetical protein